MPEAFTPFASANPFAANPFARGRPVTLLAKPEAIETHEARKPMRSYLSSSGAAGGSLDALLSGLHGNRPKPVVHERVIIREAPTPAAEDA